jgi:hypothetical protein
MAVITVVKKLDRDANDVWSLLANFGDVAWIQMAENVTVEGEGVGMRRFIPIGDGPPIVETLDAIDHDGRVLTYSIENNPLPTSQYQAVCSVTADGEGTRVQWVVTFEPIGEEAEVSGMIDGVYGMMADWITDATARS